MSHGTVQYLGEFICIKNHYFKGCNTKIIVNNKYDLYDSNSEIIGRHINCFYDGHLIFHSDELSILDEFFKTMLEYRNSKIDELLNG